MPRVSASNKNENASAAQVLAEHYQKTNELTYALRDQRDKIFIFLLIALAAATLFNIDANSSSSLLIAGLAKFLGDEGIRNTLKDSPLLGIVETLLLAAVFYLMSNLYHRTTSVLRNFHYLGKMELEIRERLGMSDKQVSFSREGTFYWRMRKQEASNQRGILYRLTARIRALDLTKYFYTILLAILLLSSFVFRIVLDIFAKNYALAVIDALIGIPTGIYWWSYARASHEFDTNGTSN